VGPGAADAWLTEESKVIWEQNRKVYGARRVHAELRLGRGIDVSKRASGGSRRDSDLGPGLLSAARNNDRRPGRPGSR
jgi:hypothetical protein